MGTSPLAAGWCPPWSVTLVERDHVPLLVRGRSEERNGKRGLILKAFKRNMEKSQIQWTKYGGWSGEKYGAKVTEARMLLVRTTTRPPNRLKVDVR